MESSGAVLTWVILGLIFGSVAALYGWLFLSKGRAFWRAMARLRDWFDRPGRL